MRMKDKNKNERPREKIQSKGPARLSDFELLQALIGSGNKHVEVSKIAKDTLKLLQKNGANISYDELQAVSGLGAAKITEILAAIELSRRYLIESEQPVLDTAEKVVEQLSEIKAKKQEYFVCLTLDGANRLIAKRTITIGTLTASLVHPREVFADAITDRAASIIVAHNHPSGSTTPSKNDIDITRRLKQSGELLGIKLIDHLVITKTTHTSILKNI